MAKNTHPLWLISMATNQPVLTVLVIDDEALLRWSIAEILRRGGHTVIEATSANHARDVISRTLDDIDVVLLDYQLPDATDLRLLDDVRRRLPHSPVVFMTAFGTPELVEEALDHGAFCVVNKPFDMQDVEGLITDAYRASWYQ